jgi:hypothetical protein
MRLFHKYMEFLIKKVEPLVVLEKILLGFLVENENLMGLIMRRHVVHFLKSFSKEFILEAWPVIRTSCFYHV